MQKPVNEYIRHQQQSIRMCQRAGRADILVDLVAVIVFPNRQVTTSGECDC